MAGMQDYKSTQRYRAAMAAFLREASKDPTLVQPVGQAKSTVDGAAEAGPSEPASSTGRVPYSLVYHQTLAGYVEELSSQLGSLLATIYGPVPSPALPVPMSDLDSSTRIFYAASPSEGLALASYCQHIRRWEIPRSSYPEGLSGYKAWRYQLNKFHTAESVKILRSSGYSEEDDPEVFQTIENLLQKKTLKGGGDKSSDEEMQIFEGERQHQTHAFIRHQAYICICQIQSA